MNINEPDAVIEILHGILTAEDADDRARRISAFQNTVWDDDPEGPLGTILYDLAEDLDYYRVLWGKERLIRELESAIGKLKALAESSQANAV